MNRQIITTAKEAYKWFVQNNTDKILSCDTECKNINYLDMKIAGISFCNGKNVCYIDLLDNPQYNKILKYIRQEFRYQIVKVIFHNAPFDLRILKQLGCEVTPRIFCTMTAAHLIDENQRKSLKLLAQKYLGVEDTISWDEAIAQGFHSKKFYKYATNDSIWTWQLYEIFKEELKKQHLEDLFYNIEMPFQFCLRDLTINGILADRNELIKLQEKMIGVVADLQLKMYEAGNIEYVEQYLIDGSKELIPSVNLNSPKQLQELIINQLDIKLTEKTDTGQLSTKNRVLESIKNKHKFISLLLEYRSASKLLNSFLIPLPKLIESDGRIRVDFRNTVAVTGRVSASRLHQLPKDNTGPVPIRQCFIPPKGKILLCADYAGQELRVLAHVSKDPTMIQAFKDKIDVHFLIANIFFKLGIPTEALVETHPDYKSYRKKFKNERDKIKTVNFGIAYGKTEHGFAKDWNIPKAEAKKFIDDYFKRFPLIKEAISKCTLLVRQQKAIRNLTGRIRRFQWVDDRVLRMAFNFLIQGPSADMMKKAAGDVRELCLHHLEWECLLVLTVHDELVYEIKKEHVEEALPLIKETMEAAIKLCIPIIVDIGVGDNYAEAKI